MIPPFFPEREDESAIHDHELHVTACEGALTEKECLEALKDMGTKKTPGIDISAILIGALNYAYKTG